MRLLLDESVPRLLAELLVGHESLTVQSLGWAGVENGELLRRAAASGYEALITLDKGFEFEQNLSHLPLTVALLRAPSNRLDDLEPFVPELLEVLERADPGTFVKVGI